MVDVVANQVRVPVLALAQEARFATAAQQIWAAEGSWVEAVAHEEHDAVQWAARRARLAMVCQHANVTPNHRGVGDACDEVHDVLHRENQIATVSRLHSGVVP